MPPTDQQLVLLQGTQEEQAVAQQEEARTAVCEICGSSEYQEVMVNCTKCNACNHCYCLEVVAFEIRGEWCCYECRKNPNGDPEPIQDADIGCESGSKSLHHHIDMPVIINSSVEYARRPHPEAVCWTRCFLVSGGENINLGEFKAYHLSRVSSKVRNIAKMSNNLHLEIQPRMNYWPKAFEKTYPVYGDITMLFFPAELECHGKKRLHTLELHCGFVMKAYVGDMMLLIYCSEVLPPDSQWIDGESYLWGVFVKPMPESNSTQFGSVAT